MQPQSHHLDETQPLAKQAAAWLLERADSSGPASDLSSWAVVVPTAESGRVLAGVLARLAPHRAVLLPRFLTPVQVLRGPGDHSTTAGATERLMAWCEVLGALDFTNADDRFEAVFPSVPPLRDFSWARGVATLFLQTQDTLMEAGWTMGDVLRRFPEVREADRWEALGALETRQQQILASWGLEDPGAVWRRACTHPSWDAVAAQWAVIGVPDPLPLLCRVLEAGTRPVHIVIHASVERATAFDAWGRPRTEVWSSHPPPISDAENTLHVHVDESGLARTATALLRGHSAQPSAVLGICREEILPRLRRTLEEEGILWHDPSGHPARGHAVWSLLAAFQELAEHRSLDALRALIVHPAGLRALLGSDEPGPPTPLQRALDRMERRHLSRTLDDLEDLPPGDVPPLLARVAHAAADWCRRMQGPNALTTLAAWLDAAYGGRTRDGDPDEDGLALLELLDEWMERAAALDGRLRFLGVPQMLALWIEALAGQRLTAGHPERAVELKGWLELAWDERPHLILCGVQEGAVPVSTGGDVFLPESLRRTLGLRTSDDILARDAFLLHGLLSSRKREGRVDLLVSKFTDSGEPLRPSRLLLQAADADLPTRVARLFGHAGGSDAAPAPTRIFRLRPPESEKSGRTISVTHFSDFLKSPLYYHLHRVLKWEEFPADKQEMDPLDFGDLAHQTLEAWGRDPVLSSATDPAPIRDFFEQDLRTRAKARYGPVWPLGVEVQIDALVRRLHRFAELQAAEAAKGWRVSSVEEPFSFMIGTWEVRGKIDRIDLHPDGRVRLWDYKTSENARDPADAHVKYFKRRSSTDKYPTQAWMDVEPAGAVWLNLQLPLYMAHWRRTRGIEHLSCGYIQLPRSLEAVGFAPWDAFTPDLEAKAIDCATSVLAALDAGCREVIPAADVWKQEPWSLWLPDGPEAVLAPMEESAA